MSRISRDKSRRPDSLTEQEFNDLLHNFTFFFLNFSDVHLFFFHFDVMKFSAGFISYMQMVVRVNPINEI